jgi:RNA polymerase sigma factor (sigma-70 family)
VIKSKYRPNYFKLYPNETISDEVVSVLKISDRKMEYKEYDLKREGWKTDQAAQKVEIIPSREDSLERLLEEGKEFPSVQEATEDSAIRNLMLEKIRECLELLAPDERELIDALFFSNSGTGMSERECAELSRIPRPTIQSRKNRILEKLKKLLENTK